MVRKITLIKVSTSYCNYLRKFDSKVPYNYDKKKNRPFIGILFKINNISYFAPLASPKIKHLKMHNTLDFFKIKNGKLGAINFNNMIPIKNSEYSEIDLNKKYRKIDDINYQCLLNDQLKWLNEHYIQIKNKSLELYKLYNSNKLNKAIKKRCCNFKLLEEKCLLYNLKYEKELVKI